MGSWAVPNIAQLVQLGLCHSQSETSSTRLAPYRPLPSSATSRWGSPFLSRPLLRLSPLLTWMQKQF